MGPLRVHHHHTQIIRVASVAARVPPLVPIRPCAATPVVHHTPTPGAHPGPGQARGEGSGSDTGVAHVVCHGCARWLPCPALALSPLVQELTASLAPPLVVSPALGAPVVSSILLAGPAGTIQYCTSPDRAMGLAVGTRQVCPASRRVWIPWQQLTVVVAKLEPCNGNPGTANSQGMQALRGLCGLSQRGRHLWPARNTIHGANMSSSVRGGAASAGLRGTSASEGSAATVCRHYSHAQCKCMDCTIPQGVHRCHTVTLLRLDCAFLRGLLSPPVARRLRQGHGCAVRLRATRGALRSVLGLRPFRDLGSRVCQGTPASSRCGTKVWQWCTP